MNGRGDGAPGMDPEVLAAIGAALALVLASPTGVLAVRSVTRVPSPGAAPGGWPGVWALAGRQAQMAARARVGRLRKETSR